MNNLEAVTQHEFGMEYFSLLAEVVPGDTTLNQIRVAQYIGLRAAINGVPACHKEIYTALKLSSTTVSRVISEAIKRLRNHGT